MKERVADDGIGLGVGVGGWGRRGEGPSDKDRTRPLYHGSTFGRQYQKRK